MRRENGSTDGVVSRPRAKRKCYVLIDLENTHAAFYDLQHGLGAWREHKQKKPGLLNIRRFLDRVRRSIGEPVICKVFGNDSQQNRYASECARALARQEYVPAPCKEKNTADIALVCDAMNAAVTRDDIDCFVIISGDSDFSPLARSLREMGKQVVGMAMKDAPVNQLLKDYCSEFYRIGYKASKKRQQEPERGPEPRVKKPSQGKKPAAKRFSKPPAGGKTNVALTQSSVTLYLEILTQAKVPLPTNLFWSDPVLAVLDRLFAVDAGELLFNSPEELDVPVLLTLKAAGYEGRMEEVQEVRDILYYGYLIRRYAKGQPWTLNHNLGLTPIGVEEQLLRRLFVVLLKALKQDVDLGVVRSLFRCQILTDADFQRIHDEVLDQLATPKKTPLAG